MRVNVHGLCSSSCEDPVQSAAAYPKYVEQQRVCFTRWYDPATTSTNVDPDLAETDQAYAYAGDDPVNAGEPSQLLPASRRSWRRLI